MSSHEDLCFPSSEGFDISPGHVAELEDQLLQSARAGQLLLEQKQEAELEVQRLHELVTSLELRTEHMDEELAGSRKRHSRQMYEEEVQRLSDVVALLEQKNDTLQEELCQSLRHRDESADKLRDELHNLNVSHTRLESEHISQGEAHEEECSELRARCRALLGREGSLQTSLEESCCQVRDYMHEIDELKSAKHSPSVMDSLPTEQQSPSRSCVSEDDPHPLESKVKELESQLLSVRHENCDLKFKIEELEVKLEDVATDAEELHEALVLTQGYCKELEQKALEAEQLRGDKKCESELPPPPAVKLSEEREKNETSDSSPARLKEWLSLPKMRFLGQFSKSAAENDCVDKNATTSDADLDNVDSSHSSHSSDSEDSDQMQIGSGNKAVSISRGYRRQSCPAAVTISESKPQEMKASDTSQNGIRREATRIPQVAADISKDKYRNMRASLRLRGGVQRTAPSVSASQTLKAPEHS